MSENVDAIWQLTTGSTLTVRDRTGLPHRLPGPLSISRWRTRPSPRACALTGPKVRRHVRSSIQQRVRQCVKGVCRVRWWGWLGPLRGDSGGVRHPTPTRRRPRRNARRGDLPRLMVPVLTSGRFRRCPLRCASCAEALAPRTAREAGRGARDRTGDRARARSTPLASQRRRSRRTRPARRLLRCGRLRPPRPSAGGPTAARASRARRPATPGLRRADGRRLRDAQAHYGKWITPEGTASARANVRRPGTPAATPPPLCSCIGR
jgi:hypothetical protein